MAKFKIFNPLDYAIANEISEEFASIVNQYKVKKIVDMLEKTGNTFSAEKIKDYLLYRVKKLFDEMIVD